MSQRLMYKQLHDKKVLGGIVSNITLGTQNACVGINGQRQCAALHEFENVFPRLPFITSLDPPVWAAASLGITNLIIIDIAVLISYIFALLFIWIYQGLLKAAVKVTMVVIGGLALVAPFLTLSAILLAIYKLTKDAMLETQVGNASWYSVGGLCSSAVLLCSSFFCVFL